MPNLKHITFHKDVISSVGDEDETLRLISQIEGFESLTLSDTFVTYNDSIQTGFNLVLPKLKELKHKFDRFRMLHILEDYPGVLDKLERLTIGAPHDAGVLGVSVHIQYK